MPHVHAAPEANGLTRAQNRAIKQREDGIMCCAKRRCAYSAPNPDRLRKHEAAAHAILRFGCVKCESWFCSSRACKDHSCEGRGINPAWQGPRLYVDTILQGLLQSNGQHGSLPGHHLQGTQTAGIMRQPVQPAPTQPVPSQSFSVQQVPVQSTTRAQQPAPTFVEAEQQPNTTTFAGVPVRFSFSSLQGPGQPSTSLDLHATTPYTSSSRQRFENDLRQQLHTTLRPQLSLRSGINNSTEVANGNNADQEQDERHIENNADLIDQSAGVQAISENTIDAALSEGTALLAFGVLYEQGPQGEEQPGDSAFFGGQDVSAEELATGVIYPALLDGTAYSPMGVASLRDSHTAVHSVEVVMDDLPDLESEAMGLETFGGAFGELFPWKEDV